MSKHSTWLQREVHWALWILPDDPAPYTQEDFMTYVKKHGYTDPVIRSASAIFHDPTPEVRT